MNYIEVTQKKTHWELREVDSDTGYTVGTVTRRKYLDDALTLAVLWIEEAEYQISKIEFNFLQQQ